MGVRPRELGHPAPDEASLRAARCARSARACGALCGTARGRAIRLIIDRISVIRHAPLTGALGRRATSTPGGVGHAWWGANHLWWTSLPPRSLHSRLVNPDTISESEMILAIPTRVDPRDLRGRAHSVCRGRASLLVSSVASFNKRPLCSGEQREQHIDLGESLSG